MSLGQDVHAGHFSHVRLTGVTLPKCYEEGM